MYSGRGARTSLRARCRIRTSPAQRLLTAPRGFSQPATSFIGSWRLGIPRTPLLAPRLVTPSHATRLDHSHARFTRILHLLRDGIETHTTVAHWGTWAARSPCRYQLALLSTRRPINRLLATCCLLFKVRWLEPPGPRSGHQKTGLASHSRAGRAALECAALTALAALLLARPVLLL